MENMFNWCSLLRQLNLSNFNTNKDTYIRDMFNVCSSFKELTFNTNNVSNVEFMFLGCSAQFQNRMRAQYKDIIEEELHY